MNRIFIWAIFGIIALVSASLILVVVYSNDFCSSWLTTDPILVAEGKDGMFISLGGLTHGGILESRGVKYQYCANSNRAVIGNDTSQYCWSDTYLDSSFHWQVTSRRRLYPWGWRTIYNFEVGVPWNELPQSILGYPLVKAVYKNGKCVSVKTLEY